MKIPVFFFLFMVLLAPLSLYSQEDFEEFDEHAEDLGFLAEWLNDTFTTEGETLIAQNEVHQEIRFVPVWEELEDLWFYMERTPVSAPETPNRQWVFRIEQQGEYLMLEMYHLPKGSEIAGGQSTDDLEAVLDINKLVMESGCEIFLTYDGFAVFGGSTVEEFCELNEHGGHHTQIRMNLTPKKLDWFEADCAPDGTPVWGSLNTAQVYRRK